MKWGAPARIALTLLCGALLGASGAAFVLRADQDPAPSSPPATSTNPRVPGISAPEEYRSAAVVEVEDALARLATALEQEHDQTGEWPDPTALHPLAGSPPNVDFLSTLYQADAFCIEAAHREIDGARRRFISVTGEIDQGICDGKRPLTEQIGADPAATSGGEYLLSDVRVEKLPPLNRYSPVRYAIVFDAEWVGPGQPVQWGCTYYLYSRIGTSVGFGEFGFAALGPPLDDYRGAVMPEHDFPKRVPTTVELECDATWE